jgi:two-component system OmpR family sensor kinase
MFDSLRSRLVIAIGLIQVVTWLAILAVGGVHMWDELEEGYNVELIQFSLSVGAMVDAIQDASNGLGDHQTIVGKSSNTIDQSDLPRGISKDDFKDHLAQVWNGGQIIFRTPTAPATRLDVPAGINDVSIAGDNWKVLRHIDSTNGNHVIVAIRRHEVNTTIIATLLSVLVPIAGAGFVGTVLTSILVARLLKPLESWAHRIGSMSPYDTAAIDDSTALREVRPVLAALNRMLDRVRESIAFERRFVQDAAHELRTPLTAIRAQIEGGDWNGLSAEQAGRMSKVRFGMIRATRLVNQLMDLARSEEPRAPVNETRVEAGALIQAKLTEIINVSQIADPTRISLNATNDELWLTCNPADIEIVLSNLVDNAAKYAGASAQIMVTLTRHDGDLVLTVEDDGPGIPEAKRPDMFKRFVRLAPASTAGSGLGLSLVKEVVTKLGGTVALGQSERLLGLKVTVILPVNAIVREESVAPAGAATGRTRAVS